MVRDRERIGTWRIYRGKQGVVAYFGAGLELVANWIVVMKVYEKHARPGDHLDGADN